MKIILATGIYPPDIGGPATYVRALAEELNRSGVEVIVVTYSAQGPSAKGQVPSEIWKIVKVSKYLPVIRWMLYAMALRKYGSDSDAVIAFSSVSAGVPLWMARLKKPKKILRLGGDFLWERFTDSGGEETLREWYAGEGFLRGLQRRLMARLLTAFDHVVFSTSFQQKIYEKSYNSLPTHSVIENAFPGTHTGSQPMRLMRMSGLKGSTLRLLCMCRFVRFKNVVNLIRALPLLLGDGKSKVQLLIVGEGPEGARYQSIISELGLGGSVKIEPPVHGEQKQRLFDEHDLLVLPSLTEISPNTALEAISSGLPVVLTEETGFDPGRIHGIRIATVRTPEEIALAIREAEEDYDILAEGVNDPMPKRTFSEIASEFLALV